MVQGRQAAAQRARQPTPQVYKDGGWQGWGHWRGTGTHASQTKQFLPFGEALRVACSHNLAGKKEWRVWCREGMRPPNVPAKPDKVYAHAGWMGWGHWLNHTNSDVATMPVAATSAARVTSKRAAASSSAGSGTRAGKRRRR